jgi:hypothetical protein
MKTKLFMLLMFLVASSPVFAQLSTKFGQPDCGQWVSAPAAKKEQHKAWLMAWLLETNEVLDARTQTGQTPPNYLGQLNSAEQAYLFTDNYCRTNPLSMVVKAAGQLMDDLIDKKINR